MSVAAQILEYLRMLERLKEEQVVQETDDKVRTQAEIFRLSAIVQRMLALEGDPIWIELEGHGVVKQAVEDGLSETWKQLAEMKIPKKITSSLGRSVVVVEFPKYLELPGPVVRRKILSYLTDPIDELNLAKAIPSEAQYLSGPLNLIQLKAVFPILMKKNLLEPMDLMNLCGADPYIQSFIQQYFERIVWKDDKCFDCSISLEQVELALQVNPELFVLPKVRINQFDPATWEVLRRCGAKIFHCYFDIELSMQTYPLSLVSLNWMKCYLELLPNLKTLCIIEWSFSPFTQTLLTIMTPPTTPEFLPELPFLKHLAIETGELSLLRESILAKYGPQLELLRVDPIGDPLPLEGIPESGATLFSVTLGGFRSRQGTTMETAVNFLNGIADCPLKVLRICIELFPAYYGQHEFPELLTLISNNWGETLECLEINILKIKLRRNCNDWSLEGFPRTLSFGFPKLKELKWTSFYPVWENREFLLCCPALEELEYLEYSTYDPVAEQQVLSSVIELYPDKELMLRSNVWKLFPKLEQVRFNQRNRHPTDTGTVVTRKECLAYQLTK